MNYNQWNAFLKHQALKFQLTPTQTRVFLTRFSQDNWLNKIEDIWELSNVNSFESFVKHSTNIYKILKPYCPDISQDFFYLLRSWHEEANNDELWEKLRLVVVYSTEDFGSLDINQSPFNIGLPIELKPFNHQQIEQLATSYQLNLNSDEITRLIIMLGGHPYLIDSLFSCLANNAQLTLQDLLQQVATDTGIYNSYLRQHLIKIKSNNQLTQVFLKILNSPESIQVDTLLAYQLYRMGLIQWSNAGDSVFPSCELYKLYFLPRLDDN